MQESERKPTTWLLRSCDELRKLVIENPNLPLLVFAGSDCNCGDYSYISCSHVWAEIGEILDCQQTVNDERVYTDRDEFEEDIADRIYEPDIHDNLTDDEYEKLVQTEAAQYESFWKPCIILYVDG